MCILERTTHEGGKREFEGGSETDSVKAKSKCYKLSLFRNGVKTVSSFQ